MQKTLPILGVCNIDIYSESLFHHYHAKPYYLEIGDPHKEASHIIECMMRAFDNNANASLRISPIDDEGNPNNETVSFYGKTYTLQKLGGRLKKNHKGDPVYVVSWAIADGAHKKIKQAVESAISKSEYDTIYLECLEAANQWTISSLHSMLANQYKIVDAYKIALSRLETKWPKRVDDIIN